MNSLQWDTPLTLYTMAFFVSIQELYSEVVMNTVRNELMAVFGSILLTGDKSA